MIVYNTGKANIFISTGIRPDPHGGPADFETQYFVGPGQGIDLSILGLEPDDHYPNSRRVIAGLKDIQNDSIWAGQVGKTVNVCPYCVTFWDLKDEEAYFAHLETCEKKPEPGNEKTR
jgi:hypothetical protein